MNIDHLKEVRADINKAPATKFDMADFVRDDPECGTVMCIAGYAAIRAGCRIETRCGITMFIAPENHRVDPELVAQEYLDLSDMQARSMFYGHWSDNRRPDITKAETLRYLDRIIEDAEVLA